MEPNRLNCEQFAKMERVYYEGTSTIYEGMPLCFNFNTTDNIDGYSDSSGARGTTTAEGYQNEGKYKRVEDPAADNIMWFAGVVAGNSQSGKIGPRWLDIYVANGAIVPVRAGVACTVGRTILSVISATQYLGQPLSATQARPVAIAEETNAALTSPGLCLARLDTSLFIYQNNTGDALIAAADGTSNIVVNDINVTSAQTSGAFCAFQVKATSSAGSYANLTAGGGLCAYFSATVSATVAQTVNAVGIQLKVTGGTPTEYLAGLHIKTYEDGATMTSCSKLSCLSLEFQVADDVQANRMGWLQLSNNGAQAADALILATNLATLPAVAFTGTVAIGAATAYGIKVYLQSQSGTQLWYIPLLNALA